MEVITIETPQLGDRTYLVHDGAVGVVIDPQRDTQFTMGPMDVLDHSSRAFSYGSKMGIDATTKWKDEGFHRPWPEKIAMDPEVKARMAERMREWGLL